MTLSQSLPNHLAGERSPYLLQHSRNPVDWYPWGDDAFSRAKAEDKPIFLSVGYSACHWCHVMARESFENESIAALLNHHFIPVKVDREERPDVDRIYMTALQAMGHNGGWPMSMFLTPSLRPFYGGTYFPPEERQGRAGFPDILKRIEEIWTGQRSKVEESANGLTSFLKESAMVKQEQTLPDKSVLDRCFDQFQATYDANFGGFGSGPKFPRPAAVAFLLKYYTWSGREEAWQMAEQTLRAIAIGGVHDHVGGGFHRYAVDAEWRIPHFEKMLYDQAQLVHIYLDAFQISGKILFADVVRSTIQYVLAELTSPEGGFLSAEDADSPKPEAPDEHGEGAFYLWTKAEVLSHLGESDGRLFSLAFGVEEDGNALVDPQMEFVGKNILYAAESKADLARMLTLDEQQVRESLERSRLILREIRKDRPHPSKDEKILTSWNGLMIGAMARAGAVLDDPEWIRAATRAATMVLEKLRGSTSDTLLHRYREGDASVSGQLDDYAFLITGLLDLFDATQQASWLEHALRLAQTMLDLFHDPQGGFFNTDGSDPSIIVRMRDLYDGAEPSGNSSSVELLLRLAVLTGNQRFRTMAGETLTSCGTLLEQQSVASPAMTAALGRYLGPEMEIVIAGPAEHDLTRLLVREVRKRFLPCASLVLTAPGTAPPPPLDHFFSTLTMCDGKPTMFVCENSMCTLPTSDPAEAAALLDRATRESS